ncbi:DNA-binding response regulator [Lottiidibacillus patelloidae]|uniref:DNA-binding response regulator n=1 Tax=Lottiidibacillus patelloidae TaxID=2670334 RepID=A0A263BXB1_9BACI|nr:response regulator transcription factor [Lottiidibacillus patelloidae]OZM57947.1 DNA-binding response regulator [Lottiidibacillus patelloidae]
MDTKIMVVDDEISIVTLLEFNLEKAGFQVITANDGKEAVQIIENENPDLIVLDLMLPGMDGIEVCKHLRQKQITTPILMLTAKDDEFDKILGLELGADDYMTKPFSPREVVARIKAILRRVNIISEKAEPVLEEKEGKLSFGDVEIYPNHFEVFVRGQLLEFTPKEFELLTYLTKHKGQLLTRDQLLQSVWNYDYAGDTRIVDVHISRLREKIEENTKKPVYIKTIRGLGYKLEAK